jgi:hypothetical protein
VFTKEQLLERRIALLRSLVPVSAETFGAISQPEAGEARVYRAPAAVTRDPLQFWVSANAAHFGKKYLFREFNENLCRPISLVQFNELVSGHFHGLHRPAHLPLHPAKFFEGALQMADEWNEVSAVAAWSDEFVAFFWMTEA